jgi:two-component system, NarL family, sensor kinase
MSRPPALSSRVKTSDDEGVRPLPPAWLGWVIAALAVVLVVAGFVLGILGSGLGHPVDVGAAPVVSMALIFPLVGAVIVAHRARHPMGWLFCGVGLAGALTLAAGGYAQYGIVARPGALPGAVAVAWVSAWIWVCGFIPLVTFGVLLFPDGHLPSRRWRPLAWISLAAVVLPVLEGMFRPGNLANHPARNPLGIPGAGPLLAALGRVGLVCVVIGALGALFSLAVRWRRGGRQERQQLKWFLVSVVLVLAVVLTPINEGIPMVSALLSFLTTAMLGASVGVAILRHRLYDIDVVVNRSLLYGGLTACVVALSAVIVALLGLLVRDTVVLSLLGTAVAVTVVLPLRDRAQRLVNGLTYGDRDDPYAAVSRLAQRLELAVLPAAVVDTVVDTVAQALRVPYVAVQVERQGVVVVQARAGTPPGHDDDERMVRLPLTYQGERVGTLVTAPRPGEVRLDPRDRMLLEELARQAGIAAHAVRLSTDLQLSRERLVAAREEERRRLRRDLHDGLGPTLAGIALGLDVAGNTLASDPDAARALLRELKQETAASIGDVRRLVNDLRPPALDEFGLTAALRQHADRVSVRDGRLAVTVDAPPHLLALPAAVEVAAYRIAMEAVTNAARHASARQCRLRLSIDDTLEVEVWDDGVGLPAVRRDGVGLAAMRERAAELGGTCLIDGRPGGGTRVLARLPLPRA